MPKSVQMAFDRSMRRVDQDGRLHVEISNISKACINPYYGNEIPEHKALGLEPTKMYMLLRDPGELERAASTFNNIPILSKHIPVTADAPQKELVVGSTGTDARFDEPYLMNSLVVWDAVAIAGINTKEVCELSSAYRYRADMTPGTYNGVQYDGVMRDIRGNHVALVEVGRAGPDVYVFDSQPVEQTKMKLSRIAVAIQAALAAHMVPKLAQDAKLGDLGPVVKDVKRKTIDADTARIAADVVTRTKGKLAQDATIDAAEITRVIKLALDAAGDDDDEDDDEAKKKKAALAADDEDDDAEKKKKAEAAMDAAARASQVALDAAIKKAQAETVTRMQAIRQAEKDVQPIIGEVVAQDSAEAVYKLALDHAKVDVTDVHPSAYRALVTQILKQGETAKPAPRIAADAASVSDFAKRFPNAKMPARS